MVARARITRRLAVAGLLLAVCSFPGGAQQADRLVPRRMLLVVTPQADSHFTVADSLLVQRSLHERLQEAEPDLLLLDSPPTDTAVSAEELATLAGKSGADAWMQITVGGDWSSARVEVKVVDLLSRTSVADFTATRTRWGSVGGLSQEAWADVAQAVAGKLPPVENSAAEEAGQNLVQLTVSALPGSLITGLGKKPLRVGPEGSVSTTLPPWHEYSLRASLPGYVPIVQRVFLSEDREISLVQKESSRWGWELSLSDTRAPGLDVTMAVPAHSLFFRFGFATYAFGLSLDGTHIFLTDPLTNFILQAGWYLTPEDASFRLYVALGGIARVLHEGGTAPVLEQLAPVGVRAVVGVELPGSNRSRFFAEYTPTMFATSVPEALRASMGQDVPGWIFLRANAADLLSFRVGWRRQL